MSRNKGSHSQKKWDLILDHYLMLTEFFFKKFYQLKTYLTKEKIVSYGLPTKLFFNITLLGLLIVFFIIFNSCQSPRHWYPVRTSSKSPFAKDHNKEAIYLKQDQMEIERKEPGSSTGSLWTDTPHPWNLYTNPVPGRIGDVVTVHVGAMSGGASDPREDSQKEAVSAPGGDDQKLQDIKMQITGFDSDGAVLLRHVRYFDTEAAGTRFVSLEAQLPSHNKPAFDLDAKDLTHIKVTENNQNADETSVYATLGWDDRVTRHLNGFNPEVQGDRKVLEDLKKDLDTQQNALNSKALALKEQEERVRKDRQRLLSKTPNSGVSTQNNTVGHTPSPPSAVVPPFPGPNGTNPNIPSPGSQPVPGGPK